MCLSYHYTVSSVGLCAASVCVCLFVCVNYVYMGMLVCVCEFVSTTSNFKTGFDRETGKFCVKGDNDNCKRDQMRIFPLRYFYNQAIFLRGFKDEKRQISNVFKLIYVCEYWK